MTTVTATPKLRSPFPYFGGKSKVAPLVWSRFGDVRNYVEPFFGSGAMLLGRPDWPFENGNRIETVNDKDCFLANFWRALKNAPDEVAEHADWPVNEADLHARHLWLVNVGREHVEKLRTDPDYFDAKIAGWWVWGICQWIGSGWCHELHQKRPHLGNAGRGIHRPSQQLPHLGNALGNGIVTWQNRGELYEYFDRLAARLSRVRICCGDWQRVCGNTPTVKQGLTGVFLDPPYNGDAKRKADLYAVDDLSVSNDVRKWCLENGGDKRLRIAFAGYAGEGHEELESHGWEVVAWKANGGYGSQGSGDDTNGRNNAKKERIWFSPHCLKPHEGKPCELHYS